MTASRRDWLLLAVCVLGAACMWSRFGVIDRIPEAFSDVVKTPHGIFSDLYPRWLGARELLLRGRNPYGAEVTREIQEGFYGRSIRPGWTGEPKDEARFAYPVYVAFLLAPTITLSFQVVKTGFYAVLVLSALLSAWCWMRWFQLRLSPVEATAALVLLFGSWPVSDTIHMQQPSLLVCAALSGAVVSFIKRKFFASGVLLAVAMIKPHLALPLIAWLVFLSLWKWRERKALVLSLSAVMLLLVGGSEMVLPGWIPLWIESTAAYTRYTDSVSLTVEVLGRHFGIAVNCALIGLVCFYCWKSRDAEPGSDRFGIAAALILSCTMALSPVTHPYDQIFLVPAVIVILRAALWSSLAMDKRLVLGMSLLLMGSIWIFAALLAFAQLFAKPFARLAVVLMLYPLILTPLAALAGLLLTAYWSGTPEKAAPVGAAS